MNGPGLALVWFLAGLPLLVEALSGGALAFEGASRLGLCALPWLALAGIPRRPAAAPPAPWRALLPVAVALPALGLGAGLDLARGSAPGDLARCLVPVLLLIAVWSDAASLACRGARPARYGALWLVLVPGTAALAMALAWVPVSGTDQSGALPLALANPLVWSVGWTGGEPVSLGAGLVTVGVALVVWSLARGTIPAAPSAAASGPPGEAT